MPWCTKKFWFFAHRVTLWYFAPYPPWPAAYIHETIGFKTTHPSSLLGSNIFHSNFYYILIYTSGSHELFNVSQLPRAWTTMGHWKDQTPLNFHSWCQTVSRAEIYISFLKLIFPSCVSNRTPEFYLHGLTKYRPYFSASLYLMAIWLSSDKRNKGRSDVYKF